MSIIFALTNIVIINDYIEMSSRLIHAHMGVTWTEDGKNVLEQYFPIILC